VCDVTNEPDGILIIAPKMIKCLAFIKSKYDFESDKNSDKSSYLGL